MLVNPSPKTIAAITRPDVARIFSRTPESVAMEQFASLWRRFPTLRKRAANALKSPDPVRALKISSAIGIGVSATLTGGFAAGIKAMLPHSDTNVTYGGLPVEELTSLMSRYKSGRRDMGAYLLLWQWKHALAGRAQNNEREIDPRLVALTVQTMERAIAAGDSGFFHELAAAMDAVGEAMEFTDQGRWDHNPADEWKFALLVYLRTHPKPKYPMRELRGHLEDDLGAAPDDKTIRSFCANHGIALDARPGAPRKNESPAKK